MSRLAQYSAAALLLMAAWFVLSILLAGADEEIAKPRRVDPAAWGSDHVGRSLPEYMTGDECLFCHRKIGPTWRNNHHQLTIRPADPDEPSLAALRKKAGGNEAAAEARYLLGSKRITRFLKRSKRYGKLDILAAAYDPRSKVLKHGDKLAWDNRTFAGRCAGCHTTAVHNKTRAFSSLSLDCYTCHGNVVLAHTKDVSRVLLSSKHNVPREVVSICGQCHLRGGKSKSSGLPYPNQFVAGDNLFHDFQVDWSDEAIKRLPTIQQHIYLNARDVAVYNRSAMTCVTCHSVHGQSSEKHQQLTNVPFCASCHVPGTENSELRDSVRAAQRRKARSRICDY